MIERLRRKLRLWLFPRLEVSSLTITVSLDGYEEMAKQLKDLECRLERICAKSDKAGDALGRVTMPEPKPPVKTDKEWKL